MPTDNSSTISQIASDTAVPRSIVRAMEGAKDFLHSTLLKVPWLWRADTAIVNAKPSLNSDELREHCKEVRSQINVYSLLCISNTVASSSNYD